MSKVYCPQCDHKPFMSKSGLKWHQEHVHNSVKPASTKLGKPANSDKVETNAPQNQIPDAQLLITVQEKIDRDMQELKRDLKEQFEARLAVFRDRDDYLFEKVAQIEKTMGEKGISKGCTFAKELLHTIGHRNSHELTPPKANSLPRIR